jgi:hypothetical protein
MKLGYELAKVLDLFVTFEFKGVFHTSERGVIRDPIVFFFHYFYLWDW